MNNFGEIEGYIRNNFLDNYFAAGFTRFVEKGETIFVDKMEFFVNDCKPKCGYVNRDTNFELQTGFTKDNFQKKQIQADKSFAERLQNRDLHRTQIRTTACLLNRFQPLASLR